MQGIRHKQVKIRGNAEHLVFASETGGVRCDLLKGAHRQQHCLSFQLIWRGVGGGEEYGEANCMASQ